MNLAKGTVMLLGLTLLAALPAFATRVNVGASGRGPINPALTNAQNYANCQGSTSACMGFEAATFTLGATTFNGFDFTSMNGIGVRADYEVFQITIEPGQTYDITLSSPLQQYGLFLCKGDTSSVFDSESNALSGLPCTLNENNKSGFIQESNNGQIIFGSGSNEPTTWTFYVSTGSETPEPGTFVMLASGLLGLAGIRRRLFRA